MRNRTCAWAPPWIPLLCQQTRGTVWLKRHDRMIDRAGPFIKPCAFGAPQAALGLAERSCPVARVCRVITAVSSMPHYCRSPQAQELFWTGSKKFLTKGASYKPAHDAERIGSIRAEFAVDRVITISAAMFGRSRSTRSRRKT